MLKQEGTTPAEVPKIQPTQSKQILATPQAGTGLDLSEKTEAPLPDAVGIGACEDMRPCCPCPLMVVENASAEVAAGISSTSLSATLPFTPAFQPPGVVLQTHCLFFL